MEAERRLQIRTGMFTLLVLLALGVVVATLNREGGLFVPRYTLYAEFNNIEGLFVNAPVNVAGNQVGRVRAIDFLPPGSPRALRVALDIDARVQDRICTDSVASVRTRGVLGDMYVEISLGSESAAAVPDRGTLTSQDPLSLNELADKGSELLANMVALSASAEAIVGNFEESMGTQSVASTLGSLQRIVHQVETGEGALHALIYEDASQTLDEAQRSLHELQGSLQRVNAMLTQVEEGDGLLHDFIYGTEETDMSTLAAIKASAERLENVLRKIDEGEGTLGALLNDPTVYEDFKLIVGGARESLLLRGLIEFVRSEDGGTK